MAQNSLHNRNKMAKWWEEFAEWSHNNMSLAEKWPMTFRVGNVKQSWGSIHSAYIVAAIKEITI